MILNLFQKIIMNYIYRVPSGRFSKKKWGLTTADQEGW
jgi:hypothetical protein